MADRTELLTAPAAAGADPPASRTHADLTELQARSLAVQDWIRRQTFSPEARKRVRPFSLWETAELVLRIDQAALRARLAADPTLPQGESAPGGQRWFTLAEIDRLRARLGLAPPRPAGRRAVRTAIANFKGGAGKSTTALHFAHAAALEGYRVLAVDCDPQATLSRAMGLVEVAEERTVWGIMVRDLVRDTEARAAAPAGAESGTRLAPRRLPAALTGLGLEALGPAAFIEPTAWPGIDIIPSCANAGFVEFASAQYRHLAPDWPFFACLARFLDALEPDAYDLVLFDCPPAIGYQALNAVCAADVLYIPSGPGYWEYDSTTSFLGQLAEALEDLEAGFGAAAPPGMALPKEFLELRFLMTRYEPTNALHAAMLDAFRQVFGEHVAEHAVEHTRAVEQSGRFLASVYEMDPRDMTRETWRRARASFDRAYGEFAGTVRRAWERLPEAPGGEGAR